MFISQSNRPWYCSKMQFADYILSRAQGKNRKRSLLCAIPLAQEDVSFQNVLIEETSLVERLFSLVNSTIEGKSNYNIHIPNVNSVQHFLEELTNRGDVQLYCLSTLESSCPHGFHVIQVHTCDETNGQSMKEIPLQTNNVIFRPAENTVCFMVHPDA